MTEKAKIPQWITCVTAVFNKYINEDIVPLYSVIENLWPCFAPFRLIVLQYGFHFRSPICRQTVIQFPIKRRFGIAPSPFIISSFKTIGSFRSFRSVHSVKSICYWFPAFVLIM